MSSTLQTFYPGERTGYTYQAPAQPERRKAPRPESRKGTTRVGAKGKTILIVDDQAGERKVIRAALEGLSGYRVCGEAKNGTEAVERARELKPNLVVMDLAMPMMNGLEAASVLKNHVPETFVVLFTLYADLVGPRSSMFGVTAVLAKEEGLGPLMECVKKLLGPS
jgi:DNA-binding NarL/FixJ family response regulator